MSTSTDRKSIIDHTMTIDIPLALKIAQPTGSLTPELAEYNTLLSNFCAEQIMALDQARYAVFAGYELYQGHLFTTDRAYYARMIFQQAKVKAVKP